MNTDLLTKVEKKYIKKLPEISVGDQVEVSTIVREKNRNRIQVFKGLVISIKGSGTRKTFTVRKISAGIGVEKIFPLYSPNIEKIKITKKGNVKSAKLYYLRERVGKKALKVRTSDVAIPEEYEETKEEIEASDEEMEKAEQAKDEVKDKSKADKEEKDMDDASEASEENSEKSEEKEDDTKKNSSEENKETTK